MSLQLIYTSSFRLLDSAQSGYGTVARSEIMPAEMRRRLIGQSRYRENSGIIGVQYTYSTLGYAGQEYHVFTACQLAGADYSGRSCFISHHLVLLPEEVAALRRNDTRPTPAGILLALTNANFWCRRWDGDPCYLRNEPQLSREHLPDSTTQPTWKRLTGHKRNAKAFFTPPFERDCLIVTAPGSEAEDILRLLHESDCLSPHCGWGKTFTTHADNNDSFRETQRWVCTNDSPLIHKAMRTGHPVLLISRELDLAAETNESSLSESSISETEFREQLAARRAARMVPAYRYTEESDAEIYAPTARTRSAAFNIAFILGGLALLAAGSGGIWYITQPEKRPVVKVMKPRSAHSQLAGLLEQDYNAGATEQALREIGRNASSPPYADTELNRGIVEIIDLLQQASEATRHVRHLRRLCSLAQQHGIDRFKLCLIYMQEATHNRPVEDWLDSFSREELQEWESFIVDEPQLRQTLSHPNLLAYFDSVMDSSKKRDTPQDESGEQPLRGQRLALTVGDELPLPLAALLKNTPRSLTKGVVRIVPISATDETGDGADIALNPELCILKLETTDLPDCFLLRFINPTNLQQNPHPELLLEIRDNRLHNISRQDTPVAISLPLESGEQVLLVPRISIPLSGIQQPAGASPAEREDMLLAPEDIEILPPSPEHMAAQLQLRTPGRFAQSPSATRTNAQKFTFRLPKLTAKNVVATPEVTDGNPVSVRWDTIRTDKQTSDYTVFTCSVTPISYLKERILETFDRVANQCCAGEVTDGDPMYSLAMAYTTINILGRENLTEKESTSAGTRYCTLFANKKFNELMQRVLPEHPDLLLSYEAATSRSASAMSKRRQLIRRLEQESDRRIICKGIRRYLSDAMQRTYRAEQAQTTQDIGVQLVLQHLRLNESGELVWHFLLRPMTASDVTP